MESGVTEDEFRALQPGDLVRHKHSSSAAIVHANFGKRVTAVRTFDLTNPCEWNRVAPDGSIVSTKD